MKMMNEMVEELEALSGMDGYAAEQLAYKIVRAFLLDEIKCSTNVIANDEVDDVDAELELLKALCKVREYVKDSAFIDEE